ncbi:serine protease FAM111A [Dasypus novemcinctus]|uniref:serine protease FAM111A n=1 Tax=Dasypus novemcinctus TaxID=9361 RepID=UPI00062A9AE0|nr:serine protease FAM111A [Dasypus novemcinctus]
MSSKKPRSQKISFEEKTNRKIVDYFTQVPKEEENNSDTPEMNMGSRKCIIDKTNTQAQGFRSPKKNPKDQTMPPKKIIHVTLYVNRRGDKNMKHELVHNERDSLYTALNTLRAVKEEIKKHQDKEMLVNGVEGIQGYINLGMPLSCIPDKSHLVITFSRGKSRLVFRQHDVTATDYVKFYVYATGKNGRKIVKCKTLQDNGCILCVYAFKGETIKDAVCKDGRFYSFLENTDWKLIKNMDTILECTLPVDDLEENFFELEVKKRSTIRTATPQNSELGERTIQVEKIHIMCQYPSLKRESEKIREQFQKEMCGSVFDSHVTNFGKLTKNSTRVKVHRLLSELSDSVGYISWDNNGKGGSATCFVFKGLFIFTCYHVISDIVGEGIVHSKWADIISQCAKVTFVYEESIEKEKSCFFIEPWLEVVDQTLDYAVLKLKENGLEVPMGLYGTFAPAPLSGLIYIIGHPDGEPKSTDACAIVSQGQREEKYHQATKAEDWRYDQQYYIRMFTQRSFQDIALNPRLITYDTSFYFGASGSPVFDSKGNLIAMHSAGFTLNRTKKFCSIIEFGPTMESILCDIKHKYRWWWEEVCLSQQDVEMVSDED